MQLRLPLMASLLIKSRDSFKDVVSDLMLCMNGHDYYAISSLNTEITV